MTTPISIPGFWESLSWTDPYTICSRHDTPLPPDLFMTIYHRSSAPLSHADATEICHFLAMQFGNPPHTPQLCLSPTSDLLTDDDYLYITRRRADVQIVGSIRYRWIGTHPDGRKIHLVDAFCVHSVYRGTGVGRALLSELHHDANRRGIPYAMFLKEGGPLPWWIRPVYSGLYVYRETLGIQSRSTLRSLPTRLAHQMLRLYSRLYPDTFVLFPSHERNQIWKQYRVVEDKTVHTILICIQDTYQQKDGQRMGWITAWLESALVTDVHRVRAAEEVCHAVTNTFRYLWFNREWVPFLTDSWKQDGGFQWYTFQWSAEIRGKSYCLLHGG